MFKTLNCLIGITNSDDLRGIPSRSRLEHKNIKMLPKIRFQKKSSKNKQPKIYNFFERKAK